ncbi:MAG: hypothetical protein RLZZ156_2125, partial [Deinococcota bacterium]
MFLEVHMKKVILLVLFVITLVACGSGSRPEDAVNGFFNTLKNADFEKIGTYMEGDSNLTELKSIKPEAKEM